MSTTSAKPYTIQIVGSPDFMFCNIFHNWLILIIYGNVTKNNKDILNVFMYVFIGKMNDTKYKFCIFFILLE